MYQIVKITGYKEVHIEAKKMYAVYAKESERNGQSQRGEN